MSKTDTTVLLVCIVAFAVSGWSLFLPLKPQLFGSESIRRRLRLPHLLVMFGSLISVGMVLPKFWFNPIYKPIHPVPDDLAFLSLATVLVLFMLFGFVAFEAGTVSAAYRNQSAEKNLLVIMFSLAAYLGFGRFIYDGFAHTSKVTITWVVFQAGFACTVSLIVSNALTERATTSTNVLCAIFSAGLAYPILAGLVWGQLGLLHQIGFVDASGASAVHLLGASISLTAAAAVGPRVRLQRWRFLGGPQTPDFSSPWSVVGGLFLMFGWLGFNSGNATLDSAGHAFFNTMVGACSGALAAWLLSRAGQLIRWSREILKRESRSFDTIIEGLEARPRFVIGMMGGLVAVTANGALPEITWGMAVVESAAGGFVAVLVSALMSARSRAGQIDDPLGVIGTHGCAAIVGLLSTTFWFAIGGKPFLLQFVAQLIGCGACLVIGWLVAMVPCWLLLTIERRALAKTTGDWIAAKFRLRLGAIEQLGTPREVPADIEWNDRIEEATQRILNKADEDPDKWWDAVEIYATAAEVPDKSSQAAIAHRIVERLPDTADRPDTERIALVALSSSAEYAMAEDISRALALCLARAKSNGDEHSNDQDQSQNRREMLIWSVALLTERAAVLGKAVRPDLLPRAEEGLDFLRKVAETDENYRVRDLARTGIINSNALLFSDLSRHTLVLVPGPFDSDGQWEKLYALVSRETALAMLLFVADHGSVTIVDTTQAFKKTREDTLEIAMLLASHGLISCNPKQLTIKHSGRNIVNRLRHSVHPDERLRA